MKPFAPLWRRKPYWIAALVFFGAMIAIGSIPGEAKALSAVIYDKLLHFGAYGFLSSLIYCGIQGRQLRKAFWTLGLIGLLGALDEMIQIVFPYRHASLDDWIFNMLAASIVVLLFWVLRSVHTFSKRRRPTPAPRLD